MTKFKKLLLGITAGVSLFLLASVTYADSPNFWLPSANNLKVLLNNYGIQVPKLGSSGNPCVTVGTTGIFATSTCSSGSGGLSTTSPFTAGFVPYATSTGALTDSPISVQGSNVGIGTTTGTSTFTLQGSGTNNPLTITSSTGATLLTILTNGNVGINSTTPFGNLVVKATGNTFPIINITRSNNTSLIYGNNAGLVGIGTFVPDQVLSVNGNLDVIPNFANFSSGVSAGNWIFSQIQNNTMFALVSSTSTGVSSVNTFSTNGVLAIESSFSVLASSTTFAINGKYLIDVASGTVSTLGTYSLLSGTPALVATTTTGLNQPIAIKCKGIYCYVLNQGDSTNGYFSIFDVSNPKLPTFVASSSGSSVLRNPVAMDFVGNYLVIADDSNGNIFSTYNLVVFSIANPFKLTRVQTLGTLDVPLLSVSCTETNCFTTDTTNGLSKWLVSGFNGNLTYSSSLLSPMVTPAWVIARNSYAYVLDTSNKNIYVFDVSGTASLKATQAVTVMTQFDINDNKLVGVGPATLFKNTFNQVITSDINTGTLQAGHLDVNTDAFISGNLRANGGLTIGGVSWLQNDTTVNGKFTVASSTGINILTILPNYNVGIGSSTPASLFVLQGTAGSALNLFNVASSTGTSLFKISPTGEMTLGGGTPGVNTCGTGSPSISGNDQTGTITIGGGVVTACSVTFGVAKTGTIHVFITVDGVTAIANSVSAVSTAGFTVNFAATLGGGTFDYFIVSN